MKNCSWRVRVLGTVEHSHLFWRTTYEGNSVLATIRAAWRARYDPNVAEVEVVCYDADD